MGGKGRILLYILVMAVLLMACGSTEETLPAGVYSDGVQNYYAVKLVGGEKVSDYFVFTGVENRVSFNMTTLDDQSENLGVVYYCTVDDGGVVAYRSSETELFLYFPGTFTDDAIRNACTLWLLGRIEKSMSISEARSYIPSLAS